MAAEYTIKSPSKLLFGLVAYTQQIKKLSISQQFSISDQTWS